MNVHKVPRPERWMHFSSTSSWMPSRKVEYAYYFAIFYSLLGEALGIQMPLIYTAITSVLALHCVTRLGSRAKQIYGPFALLFGSGISFIMVQIFFHQEILSEATRAFVNWILALVVVPALSLRRKFLHRLALLLLALGLVTLPYLSFTPDAYERARIDLEVSGHLRNPIGLAEWFGFCAVYFAICGIEHRRSGLIRLGWWLTSIGCLLVVGLTVSRGPLIGCALAITVGFRRLLSRSFLPALLLITVAGAIYESGVFDRATARYADRGLEETGRGFLWPEVIKRIYASPFVGVGASDTATYVPEIGKPIASPHNSFLYFALSSGIIPFGFYLAFWLKTAWRSFSRVKRSEGEAFGLPLLIFTFVTVMLGDTGFMSPWALPALTFAAGSNISLRRGKGRLSAATPSTVLTRRSPSLTPDRDLTSNTSRHLRP